MFENILPARKQKSEPLVKIADLDKIATRKCVFVLHGKEHIISPPSLMSWLEIVEANAKLFAMKDQDVVTSSELVDNYYNLISKLCSTVTKEDIRNCTQMQISSLWQLVLDMMNGFDQKKTLLNMAMASMTKKDVLNLIQILNSYLLTRQDYSQNSAVSSIGQ